MGECHVHAGIRPDELEASRKAHSDADLLIHPECGCSSQYVYGKQAGMLSADTTYMLSTEGMVTHAKKSPKDTVPGGDRDGHPAPPGEGDPGQAVPGRRPSGASAVHEADHAAEAAPDPARDVPGRRDRHRDRRHARASRSIGCSPSPSDARVRAKGRGSRGCRSALAPFSRPAVLGFAWTHASREQVSDHRDGRPATTEHLRAASDVVRGFLDWLDEDKRAEWVDGAIIEMAPVNLRTSGHPAFPVSL